MNITNHKPLRMGVLGCANIAKQFVRDVALSPSVSIQAVASRSLIKAQEFAQTHHIARSYGSYESLLADKSLDAIYIPLPNSMHAEWAIRAMQAGKHVLCEKPLALNLAEVTRMFEVADQHKVMLLESYPYWFQPQTRDLLTCLSPDNFGEIRSMQASFGFTLANPGTNIRMNPSLGGGSLLDAGSYPISLIRLVMQTTPQRVMAHANWSESGVDISMNATLFYADGRTAQMSCAMNTSTHRRAIVTGSNGTLETEYLNHTSNTLSHPWNYLPSQMRVRRGTANAIPFEDIQSATGSGFRFAAEAFAEVVSKNDTGAIQRAAAASKDIAATLDAIAESARSGQLVELKK
jgi:predicted dehydrogenase